MKLALSRWGRVLLSVDRTVVIGGLRQEGVKLHLAWQKIAMPLKYEIDAFADILRDRHF